MRTARVHPTGSRVALPVEENKATYVDNYYRFVRQISGVASPLSGFTGGKRSPHGFKTDGFKLAGPGRFTHGKFHGGFCQREEAGIAKGVKFFRFKYRQDRAATQRLHFREHIFNLLFCFFGDLFTYRKLAHGAVTQRILHAPVNVVIPDIAGIFHRVDHRRIAISQHCPTKLLFEVQIKRVKEIVLGGKVAEQCPFGDTRAAAIVGGDGGNPGLAKGGGAASSKAWFFSLLFRRATPF